MASDQPKQISALRQFLASIATIPGDLSNITAPPFVLAPKSVVELPQYWITKPEIFAAPALEAIPQRRALLVLKWFLASLRSQQYAGRNPEDGIKKPLNAFLGELFLGRLIGTSGTTNLISEQVSHHPPITATALWNDTAGLRAEGYTRQIITFTTSVNIKQTGHAILTLTKHEDEAYYIPLPNVKVKGVLTGSPYPELYGSYSIVSTSGYTSEIDFSGKSFLSGGSKNQVDAKLYRTSEGSSQPLYTVSGQWTGVMTFHDCTAGQDLEMYDAAQDSEQSIQVCDIKDQDPWESRNAWKEVISAINSSNMQKTSDEKGRLEQAQRQIRAEEQTEGRQWQPTFFRQIDHDETFMKLASQVGEDVTQQETEGIWKADWDEIHKKQRPYHPGLSPFGHVEYDRTDQGENRQSENGITSVRSLGQDAIDGGPVKQFTNDETFAETWDENERHAAEEMLRDHYSSYRKA